MKNEQSTSYELGRSFFNALIQTKAKIKECDCAINNIRWDCWNDFRHGNSFRTIDKIISLMERKKKWLRFYKDSLLIMSEIPNKHKGFVKSYINFVVAKWKDPKLSIHKDFQEQVNLPTRTIFRRIALISEFVETKLLTRFKQDVYFIQEIENENFRKKTEWRTI